MFIIHVPMCELEFLQCPPPHGHPGWWAIWNLKSEECPKVGERIQFLYLGQVIREAVVAKIMGPNTTDGSKAMDFVYGATKLILWDSVFAFSWTVSTPKLGSFPCQLRSASILLEKANGCNQH